MNPIRNKQRSTPRRGARRSARRRRSTDASASAGARSTRWQRHGTALPSWSDLEPKTNPRRKESDDGSFLQGVSTVRFAALLLGLAVLFTLYVGHVHATQQVLMDVQTARQANHTLHLKHNRLKGEFDHATGPSVIYERARALGLQETVPAGRNVVVND